MKRHASCLPRFFSFVTAALLLIAIVVPFFQILSLSFLSQGGFSLEAYYKVLLASPAYLLTFWRTLGLCALIVAGQLVLSVLAGFGFAKYPFPGKNLCLFLLIVVMVLPLQVTLVPNFRVLEKLGLLNTQWALVLPAMFAPLGTFLMTQSFRSVPDDILEAARLDGATLPQALWRVLLPINQNGLACVVILSFLEAWNMVEQPIVFLKDPGQYPLSVAVASTHSQTPDIQLVCCLLTLLPPLLLFWCFHRELVQGITLIEGNLVEKSSKRGFIFALLLVSTVLVECTILSGYISRQMTIEVTTAAGTYDSEFAATRLPLSAFRQEGEETVLYVMEEGSGLTPGLRVKQIPADLFHQDQSYGYTTADAAADYVIDAARPLYDGAAVEKLSAASPAADTYLMWAPEGMELALEGESSQGADGMFWLLPQEAASQPFVADRGLDALAGSEGRTACRLFSFQELSAFSAALPWLAFAAVLVLASLVLCILFCLLRGKLPDQKYAAAFGGGCVLLWGGLFLLLGQLELPSSVLPQENIFDLWHYRQYLTMAREGLKAFSADSTCAQLLSYMDGCQRAAVLVFGIGTAALLFGAAAAVVAVSKKNKR